MDPRIEILRKNYEERLNEVVHVLGRSSCLPGAKVLDEWRFHLELTLQRSGWVAVYKPSKERQPLPGPDYVNELVMVEKVLYHNFEACVIGVEAAEKCDSISESSSLTAKTFCILLEDLYPCTKQPSPEMDGVEINNILDKLRFFKQNLWLPWDEEDDSEDWRLTALEPRMQLLYDMDQGQVSCEVAERVRRLIGQAWRAHETLRSLEQSLDDREEESDTKSTASLESEVQDEEEDLVIRIMQLHHRIDNIHKEMERLQNPLIRNLMVREKQRALKRTRKPGQPWLRLVWGGGQASDLNTYMEHAVKLGGSNDRLKVYPVLQMALEESAVGDCVMLASGRYTLVSSGGMESGGAIRGLGTSVCLAGCEGGDVMLSLHCPPVVRDPVPPTASEPSFVLSDVHVDAYNLEIGLLINSGHVLLENCQVDGGGSHTSESVGVMVREGGKLTARHCTFKGFCSGIVAYEGAHLDLSNCTIEACATGMQLHRGVRAELSQCAVSECSSTGVQFKWRVQQQERQGLENTQDLLNSLPGVRVLESELQAVQIMLQQPSANGEDQS